MPPCYQLYIRPETLDVLPKSGQRRRAVLDFFHELEDNPDLESETARTCPETGRTLKISRVYDFLIVWWVDSPVREVKIVNIEKLNPNSFPK